MTARDGENPRLRIALAQLDFLVGDIGGNTQRAIGALAAARDTLQADLVVFPELALSGYPPEDLLFHRGFRHQIDAALRNLREAATGIGVLVGYPEYSGSQIFNSAALFDERATFANHRKACLPNYRVFDEKRYFDAGAQPTVVGFRGFTIGVLICEDIWEPEPAQFARAQGAELLIVINASPFELRKQQGREAIVRQRVRDVGLPVIYLNLVGGQDELVFDGNSFVMDAQGEIALRAAAFAEGLFHVDIERNAQGAAVPRRGEVLPELEADASVYQALVLGVRDYVTKHGFPGVVLGLSGGIDSALTLAVAVDALGPQRVHAVMMPSRYTSDMSVSDAAEQARDLGVHYSVIPIEGMFEATLAALAAEFAGRPVDSAEENIQSRCRMLLLMGISNKTGKMLLTTGNKSEMSVGYATIYGDMNGGFNPIKDVYKTQVFRLARWRNTKGLVIPARIITKPPTAELRENQKDQDTLPPYEVLDDVLAGLVEEELPIADIAKRGHDESLVKRIQHMLYIAEYKRRQAAPGVKITRRNFGRDRRYPITNAFRDNQ